MLDDVFDGLPGAGPTTKRIWRAFNEAIQATAAKHAPWFVVPADNKWFTRLVFAAAVVEALENLDLAYPKIGAAKKKELDGAREALSHERSR